MSMKCYFSNRIYKSKLDKNDLELLSLTHQIYNKALHSVYNKQILESRAISNEKKITKTNYHKWLKEKFGLDDYYANSIFQESKAIISSQNELRELYISQVELDIKEIEKKISSTKARQTVLQKIKNSLKKTGKPSFNNTGEFVLNKDNSVTRVLNFLNKKKSKKINYKDIYTFEVEYLNPQLKKISARLGQLKFKLDKFKYKLSRLKNKKYIPSIVFGSKNLIRKYNNEKLPNKKNRLLNEFKYKRNKSFSVSGRKDAGFGNFIFKYNHKEKELKITTINKQTITLKNVAFPYGQDDINNYLEIQTSLSTKEKKAKAEFVPGKGKVPTSKAKPISFMVEDHKTYYIIKCQLEVSGRPVNYSLSDGVIGVDSNLDHFAVANVSKDGNLLNTKIISFDILDKSSGQVTKIIENKAKEVVDIADRLHKPIAIEKLNTTLSKSGKKYNNKKNNLTINMFAYKKMLSSIKNNAERRGIEVFEVNPMCTSIVGKFKYMKKYKTSIHQVAGYTIGRRALGYKEKIPKNIKKLPIDLAKSNTYNKKWIKINNSTKKLPLHTIQA